MTVQFTHYDAVVIGARCAGASTAMLLARQGLRVLVVDGGLYGTDTLSTHALMRGAVLQLHRWGILDRVTAVGTPPIRKTWFYYGDEVIEIPIKPGDGIDALYAPRRTILDTALVDAARNAGAEVTYQTRLVDLIRSNDDRVAGVVLLNSAGQKLEIGAGIVIGADGLRSTVARLVGAEACATGRNAAATVFAYWSNVETEGYHWLFRPGVAAGAIPTNDGLTCVFVATPERRFREEIAGDVTAGYHRLLDEFAPELASAVAGRRREGYFRGFPGQRGFLRRCGGPGWALVGDAGYFRDPLIAHGITDAFRDAEFLARAIIQCPEGGQADYQSARDDFSLNLFRLSDEIASFEWSLEELKEKHLAMSKEMGREVEALIELHGAGYEAAALASGSPE